MILKKTRFSVILLACAMPCLMLFHEVRAELPQRAESDSLKNELRLFLSAYLDLMNQLQADNKEDISRQLMLDYFSNPRVPVYLDAEGSGSGEMVSANDFLEAQLKRYPSGSDFSFLWTTFRLSRPSLDFADRYVVRAEITRFSPGRGGESLLREGVRLLFLIDFIIIDGKPADFKIRGIEYSRRHDRFLRLDLAAGQSRFENRSVMDDPRMTLAWRTGGMVNILYEHFMTPSFAWSAGAGWSTLSGSVLLDRFDSFMGFDPNMKDVTFVTTIYSFDLPLSFVYRPQSSGRVKYRVRVGSLAGVRYFETWSSSAININTGALLDGVVSQSELPQQMTRLRLDLFADAGIGMKINSRSTLHLFAMYRKGVTSLSVREAPLYQTHRYTGQVHPLWDEPDHGSSLQSFSVGLGFEYKLNR